MEVDDVLQEWTWRDQFDLVHLRQMMGSFTVPEWDRFYKQCYEQVTLSKSAQKMAWNIPLLTNLRE